MTSRKQTNPKRLSAKLPFARNYKLDQQKVAECVSDMKTFVQGGLPGVAALARVWKNILKKHGIDQSFAKHVLLHADLTLRNGKLQQLRPVDIPDP